MFAGLHQHDEVLFLALKVLPGGETGLIWVINGIGLDPELRGLVVGMQRGGASHCGPDHEPTAFGSQWILLRDREAEGDDRNRDRARA